MRGGSDAEQTDSAGLTSRFPAVSRQAPPPPPCRGRVAGGWSPTREGSGEHSEHLLGGDDQQAEGQVRRHLDRAAHAHVASSVLFVQMGVDPFDRSALVVTPRFRRGEPDLL